MALRRLMGLKTELMILLIAEMIAKRYYRTLHEGTKDKVLRNAFAQILRDEAGHVAFHGDYLRATFAPYPAPAQVFIRLCWKEAFRLVCLLVMWDHRAVLTVCRVSPLKFWRDCGRIFEHAADHIFHAGHDPA